MQVVLSQATGSPTWNVKRLGSLQTAGSVSLVDAQHVRIMTKLHSMLESINDWHLGLKGSTALTELLPSDMRSEEKSCLQKWWKGEINGTQCLLELQRVGALLNRSSSSGNSCVIVDTLSLMVGLDSPLNDSWLLTEVFAKPPQGVVKDGLTLLAKEAMEEQLEDLTLDQINLSFRKLAMAYLSPVPKTQEPATNGTNEPSDGKMHQSLALGESVPAAQAEDACLPDTRDLNTDTLPTDSTMKPDEGRKPTAQEQYVRLQVVMELLRLQMQSSKEEEVACDPTAEDAASANDEAVIEAALLQPVATQVEEGRKFSIERLQSENGAVGPYTDYLKRLKRTLERQVRQLEEEGAYAVLGLTSAASLDEVKRVYKSKALEAHPDKGGDAIAFQNLQQVYQLILQKRQKSEALLATSRGVACSEATAVLQTLDELVSNAQIAASQAATHAHMGLQWNKAIAKVKSLKFPLAVPYFCSFVQMGAFRSALEVHDPTRQASRLIFDAMNAAMKVVECGSAFKIAGYNYSLLEEIRSGMAEAKRALLFATEALKVNDGASDILNMLNNSLELAKKDPEAHHLLATVLSLRFQQISDVTQKCANQVMHIVVLANRVRQSVKSVIEEAQEAMEQEQANHENAKDHGDGPEGNAEKEEQPKSSGDENKRGPKPSEAKDQDKGSSSNSSKTSSDEDDDDTTDDTFEGLTQRMRKLQLKMRRQNAQLMQKLNADVRLLQSKVREQLQGLCGLGGQAAVSVAQKQHLFLTVAAFMDQTCLDAEQQCHDASGPAVQDPHCWEAIFQRSLGWMCCLHQADRIAIFADVRSQAFHLAALIDTGALRTMFEEEMMHRLRASVDQAHASLGAEEASAAPLPEGSTGSSESPGLIVLQTYRERILLGLEAVLDCS